MREQSAAPVTIWLAVRYCTAVPYTESPVANDEGASRASHDRKHRRGSLVSAIALLCLLWPAHATAQAVERASLSGKWTGAYVVTQTGKCPWGGPERAVELILQVDPDGTVRGNQVGVPSDGRHWEGHIEPDLRVTLRAPGRAVCESHERKYTTKYKGKFMRQGEHLRLGLEGADAPCPHQGCRYKREYRLIRESDDQSH